MFVVGFIIFSLYIYVTIWSIFYNSRKQQEENYPNLNHMGEEDINVKDHTKEKDEGLGEKDFNCSRTS